MLLHCNKRRSFLKKLEKLQLKINSWKSNGLSESEHFCTNKFVY